MAVTLAWQDRSAWTVSLGSCLSHPAWIEIPCETSTAMYCARGLGATGHLIYIYIFFLNVFIYIYISVLERRKLEFSGTDSMSAGCSVPHIKKGSIGKVS